jgi:dienelactone hydrolase
MSALEPIDYAHDGLKLAGRIARPAGSGPHPAILVMHSALGPDQQTADRAQDLAKLGYVALATDLYGLGPAGPDLDYVPLFQQYQEQPDLLRARILAGYEALRALPGVDAGRIAAIGYCFGGQCVLELARSGADVRSVVSFHGLLRTARPAQPGTVRAHMLVLTGAKDPFVPEEDVRRFQEEMTTAQADWQLTVYGDGYHSFTAPEAAKLNYEGIRYNPLLDRLSWAQATAFLDATLSSPST